MDPSGTIYTFTTIIFGTMYLFTWFSLLAIGIYVIGASLAFLYGVILKFINL